MANSDKQAVLNQIQQQLEASVDWASNNAASMDIHRVEGTLPAASFKTNMLACLTPFEAQIKLINLGLTCGFEIEFYLRPENITTLEKQFADILPDYQMLLINLDKVIKTNHRNFYLIKENTGQPPEGFNSYEIVSPILDIKSLPYFLEKILQLLKQLGAQDNDSIGFHLHVSTLQDIKLSPIALLHFLDKAQLLDSAERKYTRDIIKQFFDFKASDWQWIFEEVTRKCYNVNLLHYSKNNHIELRSIGGSGFLENHTQLIKQCFDCFLAYEQTLATPTKQVAESIINDYSMDKTVLHTQQLSYQELQNSKDNQVWFV